jgi:argininosuccinate lyase
MPRKPSSRKNSSSSAPIWAKRTGGGPSPRMLAYCAGRDVAGKPPADEALIPYDLWTNRAHNQMLARRGVIDVQTLTKILGALSEIESRWRSGRFRLDPRLEDVHINIERAVASIAGEDAAGVMHTARSRNDQSATDMRLWLRDRLLERLGSLAGTIEALARLAARHAATISPGWTHGQPAMPTTLGHWAAAHATARSASA